MWGRLPTCAAVAYRRRSAANAAVGRLPIGRRIPSCPTRSTQHLFPHGDAANEIEIDGIAETGFVAQRDGAVRCGFDGGLDDVALPVAPAGGDVAGKHEVRQAGEGPVVGTPDAGLQHAAAPDRNGGGLGDIVYPFGLAESGHPAELDVDDAAGAQLDGLLGVARGANALVQADGSFELRLERGVIDDVVVIQRLLDHHQVKIVQLAQVLGVGQGVGGVGVGHQLDRRETFAHAAAHVDVPAGLDLHLDALIAGGEFDFDFFEQLLHGILYADGDAAGNLAARAGADLLPQRDAVHTRFQVPDGVSQAAARHVVTADVFGQGEDVFGGIQRFAEHARGDVIVENAPGGGGPLLVVEGVFAGGDFAPTGDAVAGDFHQNDVTAVGAGKAGFEEMHQRHADLAQGDAVEFHCDGSRRET